MSFTVNKIILLGSLGRDADIRYTQDNKRIVNFSLATSESYKKDDKWVEKTTWHGVTDFGTSDYIADRLLKGTKVYVEGRIEKEEYTDKEGVKQHKTKVIANKIIPLSESNNNIGTSSNEAVYNPAPEEDLPF